MTDIPPPPLAGVVGWPIGHSRSPVLHGHWLSRYRIKGYYIPIGLRPQDFEDGIRSLPRLGFRGVNLTIPFKETILSMADSISDRAALIGAANTLVFREDGSIYADNTDGIGFLESVRSSAPYWSPKSGPALVIGAGGAARAIVSALLTAGVPEVRLANRTRTKAEMLKEHFGARVTQIDWERASEAAAGAAIIVNTTALGMVGKPPLNFGFEHAAPNAVVVDIVYTPLETEFLKRAAECGLHVVDGVGMLLHQAVPGFESWFGVRPEVDEELRNAVLSA
ncbi:shikimate dehydrogenase [Halovulum dunhuangense]|uniref:Shikimate dehydrogenase (NADP(+)) n=1 Tax=Halovulum dunhuangense TaxID=1505036 RepID=A0A849KX93_9RHOB|nr:shikimate dehydrogenase [Halovulum dunhuangense]NNU79097.1 shikimate dehydrogenase [Halovulum dunhuangense]